MKSYAFVLLAAGGSTRMGSPKQLLSYEGRPLLRHAAETALETSCRPVIVVLGSASLLIKEALVGLPVNIVVNRDWERGMGTSIHAGVQVAAAARADALILGLADQPMVTSAILQRLINEHERSGQPIIASSYAGTAGVPAFFARGFFDALLHLKPDQGCKGLILGHSDITQLLACPQAEIDVDTPDEYGRLMRASVAPDLP
jgi:molybdenum cofactor cytidylyltransferase